MGETSICLVNGWQCCSHGLTCVFSICLYFHFLTWFAVSHIPASPVANWDSSVLAVDVEGPVRWVNVENGYDAVKTGQTWEVAETTRGSRTGWGREREAGGTWGNRRSGGMTGFDWWIAFNIPCQLLHFLQLLWGLHRADVIRYDIIW